MAGGRQGIVNVEIVRLVLYYGRILGRGMGGQVGEQVMSEERSMVSVVYSEQ